MIVVDASVVLAILLREPEWTSLSDKLAGEDLGSPASLPLEIGNSLSALYRRKLLEAAAVGEAWESFRKVPIRLLDIPYTAALALVVTHSIYAYDAYVLATARRYGAPLLTLDRSMIRIARETGIPMHGES